MEEETRKRIEGMVLQILKESNIEETTEFSIRVAASERLGIDLSEHHNKLLVRRVIESFLISIAVSEEKAKQDDNKRNENKAPPESNVLDGSGEMVEKTKDKEVEVEVEEEENVLEEFQKKKKMMMMKDETERVVCQLSNKRNVSVGNFKGSTMVSIREFYCRDGKQLPGPKGISLPIEQWSNFKKSVPAIEEAIAKMERNMRSDLQGKQNGDMQSTQHGSDLHGKQNGNDVQSTQHRSDHHGKQNGNVTKSVDDAPPLELVPIEVIRFDGKNYQSWAMQMELLLKQSKIEYVLNESCPNATLAENASAETKAAEKRWVNDDAMCHRNILNHLSDPLFNQYANRKMSAKELWEDLKQVYMFEEFGTKRSLVKTYIEFQIVDDKAITEQIQELNSIADSVSDAGMYINENFHVSVIISKLPLSWKSFSMKVICEEHLPFWKLMERIRIEEESRNGVKQVGEPSNSTGFVHRHNKFEPRRTDRLEPRRTDRLEPRRTDRLELRRTENKPPIKHRNKSEIDNSKSVRCDICGKRGHLSERCWGRFEKQANERKAGELCIPE